MSENHGSSPAIRREKKTGRFMPGMSPNPTGRAKTAHISQALRQRLDSELGDGTGRTCAQGIADRLVDTALFAKRESQATQAAETIADRVEGKPSQSIQVSQTLDESTLERLVDIGLMLERLQIKPELPVLEATVVNDGLDNRKSE